VPQVGGEAVGEQRPRAAAVGCAAARDGWRARRTRGPPRARSRVGRAEVDADHRPQLLLVLGRGGGGGGGGKGSARRGDGCVSHGGKGQGRRGAGARAQGRRGAGGAGARALARSAGARSAGEVPAVCYCFECMMGYIRGSWFLNKPRAQQRAADDPKGTSTRAVRLVPPRQAAALLSAMAARHHV
jgi:hypothetical protein